MIIDSRMVPRYQRQWHEFDVTQTVKVWQKRPRRNLGIVVEVEDEDRNKVRADRVFKLMNCSDGEPLALLVISPPLSLAPESSKSLLFLSPCLFQVPAIP